MVVYRCRVPTAGEGTAGAGACAAALAPCTALVNRAALIAAGWNIMKEAPTPDPRLIYLLASKANVKQIFLENSSDSKADLLTGTYMGKGGAGEFKQVGVVSENEKPKAWRYTRLTEYKKDTHKLASGSVVLGPLGDGHAPEMKTCAQVEQTLGGEANITIYGHCISRGTKRVSISPGEPAVCWVPSMKENEDGSSFSAVNLGQWLLSHEIPSETEGKVECKGLLRPAFELFYDPAQRQLAPSPRADANPLNLFAVKKVHFDSKSVVAL